MKLTLGDLLNAKDALNKLAETKGLKASTAFVIARNIREINPQYEEYDKTYKDILNKYAVKDDKGEILIIDDNQIKLIEGKSEDYFVELSELLNVEVEMPISPVALDELDGAELSPMDMLNIDFMIKEPEDKTLDS